MRNWNFDSKLILDSFGGVSLGVSHVMINDTKSLGSPIDNALMFATKKKFNMDCIDALRTITDACIIIESELIEYFKDISLKNHIIVVENPRLYFAKALKLIIESSNRNRKYIMKDNNIIIGENVCIGRNCTLEPSIFIDNNVVIGDDVIIKTGAKIRENVIIGNNVVVGENTVIGGQGFGIEKDSDGRNIRIPHIGGVIIGNNVEIGALASIASGTMEPTIIEDNCFIDDLNHIGHNCKIGTGTMTTACAQFGGSSSIGANGYIAPNSTIRNGIKLGDNCFVGQTTSVQKSFGDNVSLVGSPAREFERK